MKTLARIALRIGFVCTIVLLCGAMYCTRMVGDVGYAPGYGYVVKVHERADNYDDYYFFIFDTEEEARDFENERLRLGWTEMFAKYRPVSRWNNRDKYDEIGRLLLAEPPTKLEGVPNLVMPAPIPPEPM